MLKISKPKSHSYQFTCFSFDKRNIKIRPLCQVNVNIKKCNHGIKRNAQHHPTMCFIIKWKVTIEKFTERERESRRERERKRERWLPFPNLECCPNYHIWIKNSQILNIKYIPNMVLSSNANAPTHSGQKFKIWCKSHFFFIFARKPVYQGHED